MLPDLQKELAFWVKALRMQHWRIDIAYEDDCNIDGKRVLGWCIPDVTRTAATIRILTPTTPELLAEFPQTLCHEILHAKHASAEMPGAIEEPLVEDLAEALVTLRSSAPAQARILARAINERTLLASRVGARAGGKQMDPEQLKAILAALKEGNGEAALALLEELLAAAVTGEAQPADQASAAAPPPAEDDKPAMGLDPEKDKDDMARSAVARQLADLEARQRADREAAVDAVLDTRPDLSNEQRARLRARGIVAGLAELRADIAAFCMPPKETKARMGADRLPRQPTPGETKSEAKGRGFRPSGNEESMRRLRVVAEPSDELFAPGCKLHDEQEREATGRLMTMSIWGALPALRKASEESVAKRARKMGGDL